MAQAQANILALNEAGVDRPAALNNPGGYQERVGGEVADAIVGIRRILGRGQIDSTGLIPNMGAYDRASIDLINGSQLLDTSVKEIQKATAILQPAEYISARATKIKVANATIAADLNTYLTGASMANKTYKKKMMLGGQYLAGLVNSKYAEINDDYPLANLADTIQQAMNSTKIAAPPTGEKKRKHK